MYKPTICRLILVVFSLAFCPTHSNARELKILSLNAWAVELSLPEWVAKSPSIQLNERVARLPEEIAKHDPDVVVFQEVWKEPRAKQIANLLKAKGYVYSALKSASKGWILDGGNGLLVVSKLPLDPDLKVMSFSRATRWDESFLVCKKGVLKTRVEIEKGRWIDLYATHLGAADAILKDGSAESFDPSHLKLQEKQIDELVKFIRETRTSEELILAADLNTHPHPFVEGKYDTQKFAPVYSKLTCSGISSRSDCLGVIDAGAVSINKQEGDNFTYDTVQNAFARNADFSKEPPGRIDYVFGLGPAIKPKTFELTQKENPVSDHYGIFVNFEILESRPIVQNERLIRSPAKDGR